MRVAAAILALAVGIQAGGYRADVEQFRKAREAEIGGPAGWAALAGLHWLTTGAHTVGRASDRSIVLLAPSAPARLGTLTVTATGATLQLDPGVDGRVGADRVTTASLHANTDDRLSVGPVTLAVIKRGDRLALRVWDSQGPGRVGFHGLEWYAIDPAWRLAAKWIPKDPAPTVKVANVLGEAVDMKNPGQVEFTIDGRTLRLDALLESDDASELFFMFRDATSGKTTYGAGRYLYTPLPADGRVDLDFNKAKNPPCAFTDFATCPLPLPQNRLGVPVPAGERYSPH